MAPTVPGIPDNASKPRQFSATARATRPSQSLAGLHGHHDAAAQASQVVAVLGVHGDAARPDQDDGAVEPGVGDDEVAAAADDQDRIAGLIGDAHRVEKVSLGRDLEHGPGRPAEPQRRQLGEVHGRSLGSVSGSRGEPCASCSAGRTS